MTDETKIRVRLDTSQAKAEMEGLKRKGAATSKSLSAKVRESLGSSLGGFSASALAGGAVGGAVGALRGSSAGGAGDILGDTFGPIGAQLNELFLGSADDEARARRTARDDTVQTFAAVVGQSGVVGPQVKTYFDQVSGIELQKERGKSLIESDPRFGGNETTDFIDKLATAIGDAIGTAFTSLFGPLVGPPAPK